VRTLLIFLGIAASLATGCYTVLRHPAIDPEEPAASGELNSHPDIAAARSCFDCHSLAELDPAYVVLTVPYEPGYWDAWSQRAWWWAPLEAPPHPVGEPPAPGGVLVPIGGGLVNDRPPRPLGSVPTRDAPQGAAPVTSTAPVVSSTPPATAGDPGPPASKRLRERASTLRPPAPPGRAVAPRGTEPRQDRAPETPAPATRNDEAPAASAPPATRPSEPARDRDGSGGAAASNSPSSPPGPPAAAPAPPPAQPPARSPGMHNDRPERPRP
jgi:hypothetical protein